MDGVLVVDKPAGKTSHDIVNHIRNVLSQKKVGHTGTLDPMATGVLVILLGKATRITRFLELEPKVYIADAVFGITTDSQDITGNVTNMQTGIISRADIQQVLPKFMGRIEQIPPMVSAIKIKGQTLYKLARKGIEIERPPRHITIHKLVLTNYKSIDYRINPKYGSENRTLATFQIECSGGTYIRTLVHDIGNRLGVGATLNDLRRTKVGIFNIENASAISELVDIESIAYRLISINDALNNLPSWIVNYDSIKLLLNGQNIGTRSIQFDRFEAKPVNDSWGRLVSVDGTLLSVGQIKYMDKHFENAVIKPEIVFG